MACNCSSSCNCDSGVELIGVVDGVDAPSISNIVVNGDNTISFTFSDSSTITTAAVTVNDPAALSYLYYHSLSTSSFTLGANLLATEGDKLKILYTGTVPDTDPLNIEFDGNTLFQYTNTTGNDSEFQVNMEVIRASSNRLQTIGSLSIFNNDVPILGDTNVFTTTSVIQIDSFEGSSNTYDFTSTIDFDGNGGGTTVISLLNVELITND